MHDGVFSRTMSVRSGWGPAAVVKQSAEENLQACSMPCAGFAGLTRTNRDTNKTSKQARVGQSEADQKAPSGPSANRAARRFTRARARADLLD